MEEVYKTLESGSPENIPSLTAQLNIPGKEGGDLQYLGSPPQQLRLEGIIRGATSKTVLDKLKAIRAGGIACQYTLTAYAVTWIQANYLISGLSWTLEPGIYNDVDAVVLRIVLELIKA